MTRDSALERATDKLSLGEKKVPFGREFREKYFPFSDDAGVFNHGSFGGTPTPVLEARISKLREANEFLDKHFRRDVFFSNTTETAIDRSRKAVAEIVDADVDNLVLVANATTGVNAVLRSYDFQKDDVILYPTTIYGSCKNTLLFLKDKLGVKLIEIPLLYPLSNDEVVKAYTDVMDKEAQAGNRVRLAFFDAVSSMPACRIPWERLVAECRKRDVLSLVDAAHAVGLIEISLREARPDFFTSNLHKWLYVPNSCALLYVDPKHHRKIASLPVSSLFPNSEDRADVPFDESKYLERMFAYTGTVDVTAAETVPEAVTFRKDVCGGEKAIRDYTYGLAKEAAKLISERLGGTEILNGKQDDIITAMVNVRVNVDVPADKTLAFVMSYNKYLLDRNCFVPIFAYRDCMWTRWSFQVYNYLEEVPDACDMVLKAVEHAKKEVL